MDRGSSFVTHSRGRRPRPIDELLTPGALSMGRIVLPASPPEGKGPAERATGYLETSFVPLRRFDDLTDLQGRNDARTANVAWPNLDMRERSSPDQEEERPCHPDLAQPASRAWPRRPPDSRARDSRDYPPRLPPGGDLDRVAPRFARLPLWRQSARGSR